MGIAVCNVPGYGVEEVADTTLCLILNLYRRTYWLANMVKEGKKITGPEQLKVEDNTRSPKLMSNVAFSCINCLTFSEFFLNIGLIWRSYIDMVRNNVFSRESVAFFRIFL
jgi:lactate dehydrogenase-like 2-hydroxyacid dehydrogenase